MIYIVMVIGCRSGLLRTMVEDMSGSSSIPPHRLHGACNPSTRFLSLDRDVWQLVSWFWTGHINLLPLWLSHAPAQRKACMQILSMGIAALFQRTYLFTLFAYIYLHFFC